MPVLNVARLVLPNHRSLKSHTPISSRQTRQKWACAQQRLRDGGWEGHGAGSGGSRSNTHCISSKSVLKDAPILKRWPTIATESQDDIFVCGIVDCNPHPLPVHFSGDDSRGWSVPRHSTGLQARHRGFARPRPRPSPAPRACLPSNQTARRDTCAPGRPCRIHCASAADPRHHQSFCVSTCPCAVFVTRGASSCVTWTLDPAPDQAQSQSPSDRSSPNGRLGPCTSAQWAAASCKLEPKTSGCQNRSTGTTRG